MAEIDVSGACLCGAVRYRAQGEVMRFYHCHCNRCRKATGTAHASNLMIKLGTVEWLEGEALLRRYKLPEAQRFGTCFCSQCGSPMPRAYPDHGLAVLPAGSLNADPGALPQARIFWDSRAAWSCEAGGLPTFSEYPPNR